MLLFFVSLLFVAILSIITLKKKAFDYIAVLISALFGVIVINLRGVRWFSVMLIFLVVALYATYFGKAKKDMNHEKKRGADNVISNGLVAFVAAILNLPYMFAGSLAAALSDTMSSEIGILSKSDPMLIINPRKRVPKGTNGGVSPLGLLAGAVGALLMGIASSILILNGDPTTTILISFAGFSGNILDSLLGLVENKGKLSNGSVNFLATLFGGVVATFTSYY